MNRCDRPCRPSRWVYPATCSSGVPTSPRRSGRSRRPNAAIGIARAAYFPNLTLSASGGYESTSISKLFRLAEPFSGHSVRSWRRLCSTAVRAGAADRAGAGHSTTRAAANYRQTVLTAFQSVEDNLASLRILSTELKQQHTAAVAAQRTVQLSLVRYQNGVDSYVNVITAQNTFLTNREAELQVQLRQLTASVNLINNLGGGWSTSRLDADGARGGASTQCGRHDPVDRFVAGRRQSAAVSQPRYSARRHPEAGPGIDVEVSGPEIGRRSSGGVISTPPDRLECLALQESSVLSAQPAQPVQRILFASLVGTTIEFFDFYIYATAAVLVFPTLFFPKGKSDHRHARIVRHVRAGVLRAADRLGLVRALRRSGRDARRRWSPPC